MKNETFLQEKQMLGKSTSSVSFSQWKVRRIAMFEQKPKEFFFSLRAAEVKNRANEAEVYCALKIIEEYFESVKRNILSALFETWCKNAKISRIVFCNPAGF